MATADARDPSTRSSLPDYAPDSSEVRADPHAFRRRYREQDPVHFSRGGKAGPTWFLFRHDHVCSALNDPRFSRDPQTLKRDRPPLPDFLDPVVTMVRGWMLQNDPPEHTRLRAPVSRAFTPARVAAVSGRLRAIADTALDKVVGRERFDAVGDFALPFSAIAIAELLGVPTEERERFGRGLRELETLFDPARSPAKLRRAAEATAELSDFFSELLSARRREPRDDLITALAGLGEAEISWDERIATCILLLGAGHATTVAAISASLIHLLENPAELERLRRHDVTMLDAVEELLRFGMESGVARFTREDIELGGKTIPARSHVSLQISAANRDPAVFADPDRLDLARRPQGHLSFGQGIHFCLGASLARAELRVALEALVERVGQLRLAPEPIEWHYGVGRRPKRLDLLVGSAG